jgi:hypothetical protein
VLLFLGRILALFDTIALAAASNIAMAMTAERSLVQAIPPFWPGLQNRFRLLLFCGSALELSRGRCGNLYYPDNVVIAVGLKDRICERYEAVNCVKAANRHLLTLSLSQLFWSP